MLGINELGYNTNINKFYKSIDETLENLTDKNEKTNFNLVWRYSLRFAIALILLTFIVLPNISPKISYAMQELPIIGNIVIVFDKYEVGPGSSGAPEFEINKEIYEKYMKEL